MIRKMTTCLVLRAVAQWQLAVVQDLKNRLLAAAMLSSIALSVNFNIDGLTPIQTDHDNFSTTASQSTSPGSGGGYIIPLC